MVHVAAPCKEEKSYRRKLMCQTYELVLHLLGQYFIQLFTIVAGAYKIHAKLHKQNSYKSSDDASVVRAVINC